MPTHARNKIRPDNSGSSGSQKHAGGPLKRKDHKWDSVIGPSINVLPGAQLPTVRTVIQRYRGLRIDNPATSSDDIEMQITQETLLNWQKAGIPTALQQNCKRRISYLIKQWKACHNAKQAGDKLTEKLKEQLDCLVDLAPKRPGKHSEEMQHEYLKEIMRKQSHREKQGAAKRNWEEDFSFYLDQKVRKIQQCKKKNEKEKEKKIPHKHFNQSYTPVFHCFGFC